MKRGFTILITLWYHCDKKIGVLLHLASEPKPKKSTLKTVVFSLTIAVLCTQNLVYQTVGKEYYLSVMRCLGKKLRDRSDL